MTTIDQFLPSANRCFASDCGVRYRLQHGSKLLFVVTSAIPFIFSEENHGDMEVFAIAVAVLALYSVIATVTAVARDGYGHTPPVYSHRDWSALDLPSTSYTKHPFQSGLGGVQRPLGQDPEEQVLQ